MSSLRELSSERGPFILYYIHDNLALNIPMLVYQPGAAMVSHSGG